jgi:Acetyltransferase (GNAT) domain
MRFERTYDMALVRQVMTHPRVWPWISDDGSGAPEDFSPVDHPAILYLLCRDGKELLGLWMFVQQSAARLEVHTCLLPGHGFRRGREAAREAAEWIWANTRCHRICTRVPIRNRIAWKFAESAGMTEFGREPKSFLKNGILQDEILLGMSRPGELLCQQQ